MATLTPPSPESTPPVGSGRPRDLKGLVELARSDNAQRFIKYSAVSVIAVVVSTITLFIALQLGVAPTLANVIAVCAGTIPSYQLNRRWAWGKTGKGHLWKEVMPFWIISLIGLGFSTLCVAIVEHTSVADVDHLTTHEKVIVQLTNLGSFAVLWVGKFIVMNKILFRHVPADQIDPVLDGRSGIPT